jgi:hypothetical protein
MGLIGHDGTLGLCMGFIGHVGLGCAWGS